MTKWLVRTVLRTLWWMTGFMLFEYWIQSRFGVDPVSLKGHWDKAMDFSMLYAIPWFFGMAGAYRSTE